MMEFLGGLIGAGSRLLGGFMSNNSAEEIAARNIAMQREFAQNGIQWKVADARKAGIHPLYALGAQTHSFSNVAGGEGLGSSLAEAGQDVSRAIQATRSAEDRSSAVLKTVQDLELTNMGLKNELLATQIAKLKAQVGPPLPTGAGEGTRDMTLFEGTAPVTTPKVEAKQDDVSKEYGDEGLPQIPGQYRFARNWLKSLGYTWDMHGISRAIADGLIWVDRNVKVFGR